MKRSARAAGRRLARLGRVAALALLLGACTLPGGPMGGVTGVRAVDGVADLLIAQGAIAGGFAPPAAPTPGQAVGGGFVKLVYPAALAASGPDLFVADSGLGALLRVDTITQSVAMLAALPTLPGVHLAAAPDGSVYVLRPDRGAVERLTREGNRLASFASPPEVLQPAGLVIEPILNQVWIADAAGGVFAFHPSGRMAEPIAGRGDGFAGAYAGATRLAAGARQVVGIEPRCRCVIVFDRDGAVIGYVGEGRLINPAVLALDDFGRVWVMDRGDGRLKVFDAAGDLGYDLAPGQLGLADITAIAFDAQRAYFADGPGGRIGVFALLAPMR